MMDRVVDMTIKIVNERTVVEVFSYNKMKNIFKGYVDSLPQEILNMDIKITEGREVFEKTILNAFQKETNE